MPLKILAKGPSECRKKSALSDGLSFVKPVSDRKGALLPVVNPDEGDTLFYAPISPVYLCISQNSLGYTVVQTTPSVRPYS